MKEDISYYNLRVAHELDRAQRATHPNAVKAHELLAQAYLDRLSVLAAVASFDRENQL